MRSSMNMTLRRPAWVPWVGGFLLGAALCAAFCWLALYRPMMNMFQTSVVRNPAGDARLAIVQLEWLQTGDTSGELHFLQRRLEGDIVQLGVATGAVESIPPARLNADDSAYVSETLRQAVTYFDKYPRTPRVDPSSVGGERILERVLATARKMESRTSAP